MARHVPERSCVACRTKRPKRELTRLVRTPDGILPDTLGKLSGRGAYLCDNPSCWERAITSQVLERALRVPLTQQDQARLRDAQPNR